MESSPWRLFNPLSSAISKPLFPPMTMLGRVRRLFSSPIPKGRFNETKVPLKSKCRKFFSFRKLLGNLVNFLQSLTSNVCRFKRLPTFSGNSLILVLDRLRYLKCFKLPMHSGTSLIS
ncbi:hypothetical protein Hanom_Chr04g00283281 [Helianthus anomalus]